MNYTIGIAGMGFVGDALHHGIHECINNIDVGLYDPYKWPSVTIDNISDKDIVFICVPTPMGEGGAIDDIIVDNVLKELNDREAKGIIAIKSTLLPTSVTKFIEKYPKLDIATNPEFLTERRARQDFIDAEWVLIGGGERAQQTLKYFYEDVYNGHDVDYALVSAEAAMMAKYMTNTWFSVKVSLMNEYRELWDKIGKGDWDELVNAFSLDKRVGLTHLQVPGPDGDFGFGGKCFPKDLNALMNLSRLMGTRNLVMKSAWEDNKHYRNDKDWLKIDGAVSDGYQESESGPIENVVLFLDLKDYPTWAVSAKCQQISQWLGEEKPFGPKARVIIIPTDENKVTILKTEEEFQNTIRSDYHKNPKKWLSNLKDRLEDCLTIQLQLENVGENDG